MTSSNSNSSPSPRPEPEIHTYAYPEMPWSGDLHSWGHAFGRETLNAIDPHQAPNHVPPGVAKGDATGQSAQPAEAQRVERAEIDAQWLARLVEETRQAAEKGRREGFGLGIERGREEASGASRELRERMLEQGASLASSFAEERSRYFHLVEEELVRLALAIAARILRREAQMDPLLLTGAVRVALGQLAQTTEVRVHVPETDRPLWQEAFARLPNLAHRPEVVGEPEMELGECRIETALGSADLSLWPQLKEIEHGFFDRVSVRGAVSDSEMEQAPQARAGARSSSRSVASGGPRSASHANPTAPASRLAPQEIDAVPVVAQVETSSEKTAPIDESALASAMYNEREW